MTPDDADQLFRSYFRRAVPDPFPPFAEPSQVAASSPRSADHSRLTLAVGVAGLLGLGLLATGGFLPTSRVRPEAGPRLFPDATADGAKLLRSAPTGR
jgi:hypothetical protein